MEIWLGFAFETPGLFEIVGGLLYDVATYIVL